MYPTRDENDNLLVIEFGLCQYKDHQTLSIQEVPENAASGQLSRTVGVILKDNLVDSCKPGDRVAIVGIYKALPGNNKGNVFKNKHVLMERIHIRMPFQLSRVPIIVSQRWTPAMPVQPWTVLCG